MHKVSLLIPIPALPLISYLYSLAAMARADVLFIAMIFSPSPADLAFQNQYIAENLVLSASLTAMCQDPSENGRSSNTDAASTRARNGSPE